MANQKIKIIPYCEEPKSNCDFFAWSNANGGNKISESGFFAASDVSLADDQIGRMPDEIGGAIGTGGGISQGTLQSGLQAATALLGLFGNKAPLSQVENACGKQPHPLIGGAAKKAAWQKCADNFSATQLALAQKNSQSKGLSTGAWIGIAFGSVALIGFGVYFATRKPKQVVMMQAPVVVPKITTA